MRFQFGASKQGLGQVEMDESEIGGKRKGGKGRNTSV